MTTGVRQSLVLGAALATCPVAALLIGDDPGGPVARGRGLAAFERAHGLHFEPAVQAWALTHAGLVELATVVYMTAHVGVAGWALIWTWWLRRDRFAFVRDVMVATQLLLVAVYVAVPTAPPRLVPGTGVRDTLTGSLGTGLADSAHLVQSPFAAMPSGHVAFALVAGGTFAAIGDRLWLRAFGWSYPLLMFAVTVVTGHHLWLDATAALLVVLVATALARLRHPHPAPRPYPLRVRSEARG